MLFTILSSLSLFLRFGDTADAQHHYSIPERFTKPLNGRIPLAQKFQTVPLFPAPRPL